MKKMLFVINPYAGMRKASKMLPEILAVFDRIVIMAGGEVAAEMNVEDATQENVLEKSFLTKEG